MGGAQAREVEQPRFDAGPVANPASVLGGRPWPGRAITRITYFNGSEAKWHVKQAAKAWNSSGARVLFTAAPRNRADLIIGDAGGPRSDHTLFGYATLGYVPPGGRSYFFDRNGRLRLSNVRHRMSLSRMRHPNKPNYNMAGVVAHEFGHVLGLDHENDLCATMNSTLWFRCGSARPCRLLERDDIQGAIRMYGGKVRMKTPGFCPEPPTNIRSVGDPREYGVTLEWRNPRGGLFKRTIVARAKGKCPKNPGAFGGIPVKGNRPGKVVRLTDDLATGSSLRTGQYCYAFWGEGGAGLRSRRRTIRVNFDPVRPTAPTQLAGAVGPDGEVTLTWTVADHPELDRVGGSGAIGQCPANPNEGEESFEGDGGSDTLFLSQPGRYCFAAWSIDSIGEAIGPPATVFVDYAGQPPTAEFEYFVDDFDPLTVYFSNYSYDDDGEIVGHRWEFGDGATSTESDPTHTYAAPGTYNVRLTVTDDQGLTGTTTQQVTVSGP